MTDITVTQFITTITGVKTLSKNAGLFFLYGLIRAERVFRGLASLIR